jgi:hypothetical protein
VSLFLPWYAALATDPDYTDHIYSGWSAFSDGIDIALAALGGLAVVLVLVLWLP